MSLSIQTLMEYLKKFVFAKVDLEDQKTSTLMEPLPHLNNQDSKFDVKDKFIHFQLFSMKLFLSTITPSTETLKKNEGSRAQQTWDQDHYNFLPILVAPNSTECGWEVSFFIRVKQQK